MTEPLPEQSFRDLRKRRSAPGTGLMLAVVGLILLAIVGFGLLGLFILKSDPDKPPKIDTPETPVTTAQTPETPTEETSPPVTNAPPKAPVDPVLLAKQREEAEDVLGRQLKLQRALLDIEANTWGGQDYSNAVDAVAVADAAYQEDDFIKAKADYETAILHLQRVDSRKNDAFQEYMKTGQTAMDAGDGDAASDAFLIATRIQPENSDAAKLLRRSKTLNQVIAMLRKGEAHELAGRLPFASAEFAEIVALDPDYAPGQSAYKRVKETIVENKFQSAMSAALAAYDRRACLEAKGKLIGARVMRPNSPQIAETMKLIDAGIKQDKLNLLQAQGEKALAAEDYDEALIIFNDALKVEANVAFGRAGAARAASAIQLLQQLNRFLDAPDKLGNPAGLENASAAAAEAAAYERPGPMLAKKIAALDQLVIMARTPSPVLLTSDGKTSVDVYRVGRFGQIKSKELQLKPGSYTAVGVRPGYRDARVVFTVAFGKVPAPVHVACTEKIK